jgi:hypothetical protein
MATSMTGSCVMTAIKQTMTRATQTVCRLDVVMVFAVMTFKREKRVMSHAMMATTFKRMAA